MFMHYFALALVLAAGLGYHMVSRGVPDGGNRFIGVGMAYVVGFIICMICFLFTKQGSLAQEWQAISWHYFLIGIMVPGVEVGFIAMYHSGWQVSEAALTADVLVTSLLVLIGMLVFGEHLSLINLAGVLCCFAGVIMVAL